MNELRNLISRYMLIRRGDLSLPRRDEGQTLVEYALILALIAIVVIGALLILGPKITTIFNNVSSNL